MKVAIPTNGNKGMDEEVCSHFGRATTFTIYDTETNEVKIVENNSRHMGGEMLPADVLASHDVEEIICGSVGKKAVELFSSRGIKVYGGAIDTVRGTLELYEVGLLNETPKDCACNGHHH